MPSTKSRAKGGRPSRAQSEDLSSGASKIIKGLQEAIRGDVGRTWTVEEVDGKITAKHADMVNHPPHYGTADDPYEAIKVIEAWELNFSLGSVLKYIRRRKDKGEELENLRKARWYLDREIGRIGGKSS